MRPTLAAAVFLAALPVAGAAAVAQEAAPRQRASEPPVTVLRCTGNEPFWSLDLGPGTALLRRPGGQQVEETTFTGTLDSLGYLDPPWMVWRGAAASGDGTDAAEGADDDLVAVIRREQCRDSMKGDLRDARAVLSLPGGGTVTGCCTAPDEAAPTAAPGGSQGLDTPRAN